MALHVTFANLNTEKDPSFYIRVGAGKSRPDTWYRKKIEYPFGNQCTLLPRLAKSDDTRIELEAVAKAAFELGRSVEKAIQEGASIGED